jgi:hypothetical protein
MQIKKKGSCFEWWNNNQNEFSEKSDKNYNLRYFSNTNNIFFHLFLHTIVYDKLTNENIEKQGILLSWNPITKRGEQYISKNGKEEDGDLSLKRVYLPNTKTIFEFSNIECINEESYKLAEEIIQNSPHSDIELKLINPGQ